MIKKSISSWYHQTIIVATPQNVPFEQPRSISSPDGVQLIPTSQCTYGTKPYRMENSHSTYYEVPESIQSSPPTNNSQAASTSIEHHWHHQEFVALPTSNRHNERAGEHTQSMPGTLDQHSIPIAATRFGHQTRKLRASSTQSHGYQANWHYLWQHH